MIKIGSLFSGIGGFELGLERAIPNSKTIWQVEQNKFCQKVLRKHWPDAKIYDDVKNITAQNVEPIDVLCGGFPCQDISIAGKQRGIHEGKKSSLWWEMLRIIGELEPRIIVLENVHAIIQNGGLDVLGSLASIGYDAEWTVISARQFGAPHKRNRWFCVGYTRAGSINNSRTVANSNCRLPGSNSEIQTRRTTSDAHVATNSPLSFSQGNQLSIREKKKRAISNIKDGSYWNTEKAPPFFCSVDDGISDRLAKLKALGNAIVPQCSEYIGECIVKSGLLEEL
tara:strand:+ start:3125 stop:3973 length:849 start_codon:yes stop_codon:yes gene_type:complete